MLYDAEGLHRLTDAADFASAQTRATPASLARAAGTGHRVQLGLKRAADITLSLLLLIVFAPLLALIGLAVCLVDRMPPLYLQQRYGRNGVPFTIVKFRTMTVAETTDQFVQAVPGDKRITRLGRFLRRTSLDELPQLFNILVGHMSLVGPRPHALVMEDDIVARYPWAIRRLAMRPGMTGLAQVRGLRGPTRRHNDVLRRIEADVDYVDRWSFACDLRILAQTPAAWLWGRNAG